MSQDIRITRHEMFMEIARTIAKRSTCDRARVGAVLVNSQNKIVSVGYNGAPSGEPHCDEVGHLIFANHCMRAIHAEENCLANITLGGSYKLYVTHYPCPKCQIMIYEKLFQGVGLADMLVIYDEQYGKPTRFERLAQVKEVLQFMSLQEALLDDTI